MNEKTKNLVSQLVQNWDKIKEKQTIKKEEYGSGRDTVIGHLWWDNPSIIFVLVTDKEEDYEGSQAQVGFTKEGKIKWEYQSHCSCYSYEDSKGDGNDDFLEQMALTQKSYTLESIPEDWETKIQENIEKLLKAIE